MLNITYRDRKTNIWVREETKVTDVIEQVRRRKRTWAGHISGIRDNRWTGEMLERRTRRLLDLAKDTARLAYVEAAF